MDNVIVPLPAEIVHEAARQAIEQGISLQAFIDRLAEQVAAAWRYEQARERQVRMMREGYNLGTQGRITWTRDGLYER